MGKRTPIPPTNLLSIDEQAPERLAIPVGQRITQTHIAELASFIDAMSSVNRVVLVHHDIPDGLVDEPGAPARLVFSSVPVNIVPAVPVRRRGAEE